MLLQSERREDFLAKREDSPHELVTGVTSVVVRKEYLSNREEKSTPSPAPVSSSSYSGSWMVLLLLVCSRSEYGYNCWGYL